MTPHVEPDPVYEVLKRTFDLVVGGILLLVSLPVIGLLVLLTRLDSPGPAIFRQTRVGRDGRLFTFYKLRTMYSDARERFPHLYDYSPPAGEFEERYYKPDDDPRLTRFGRFIRRTSLDELPNLFNVVRGDVSFIGPRPELPDWAIHYRPEQRVKFAVRPGITGLAVVTGRNNLSIGEQIAADVEYVHRRSLGFDMKLLVLSLWVIVRRVGAV